MCSVNIQRKKNLEFVEVGEIGTSQNLSKISDVPHGKIPTSMTHKIDVLSSKLQLEWKWWNYGSEYDNIRKECEKSFLRFNEETSPTIMEFAMKFYFGEQSLAPWLTSKSRQLSKDYLEKCPEAHEIAIALAEKTLSEFKKLGITSEITASGNRSISRIKIRENLIGKNYTSSLDKREKFKEQYVTSLGALNFLVEKSVNIEQNWRYILPLLLAFLEDSNMMIKREAALCLNTLLGRLEPGTNILVKSQILPLLSGAIQPLLLALPSLTPPDQSVAILPIAYQTIFNLYKVGIPKPLERYLALDSLLSDTLLPSLTKCKDSLPVAEELLNITHIFLKQCDDYAAVVAKPIIYTLLTILMDPYVAFAIPIVNGCVDIVAECLRNVYNKEKYKYDLDACIRTLKRRINDLPVSTSTKLRELEVLACIV